jgi:hypothetical protein
MVNFSSLGCGLGLLQRPEKPVYFPKKKVFPYIATIEAIGENSLMLPPN